VGWCRRYIDSGFKGLMRPDRPLEPGCGLTDAYCADSYEVNGDEYVAIITDTRDDKSLAGPHVGNGTRFCSSQYRAQMGPWQSNRDGIIFIGYGGEVYCYLPPGGG
jgi:hypothetical protein